MARSCGLRLGQRRFELVVLEGNAKKHRIAAFQASEFPLDEDPVGAAVRALKAAAKEHSIPHDNIGLVVDSGMGAFRRLKLPFTDEGKIDQVLKFEVEGQLPQWSIDDVVVDFLPLERIGKETNLLVTAVPKNDLRAVLTLCEAAGIEPLDAELETTAMVNAAIAADIPHLDDAQVLVHIGDTTTSVVVMDGGHVRSMRAIHVGATSWQSSDRTGGEESLAAALQAVADPAADSTGSGHTGEPEVEGQGAEVPEIDPETRRHHLQQTVVRLQRELGRTISGARTINEIDAIYVCGIELPELVGQPIMDVQVYLLDVFEEDSGQPAEGTAPLVVAYGAALRYLGGAHVPASLRREDLRFTGAFEKIELPLAIASLLLVTWLSVFVIFENHQHSQRAGEITSWLESSMNYIEGNPAAGAAGYLEYLHRLPNLQAFIDQVRSEIARDERGRLPRGATSPLDRLEDLDFELADEIRTLRKDMGDSADVRQPQSALEGLVRLTGLMAELSTDPDGPDGIGRFVLRKVDAVYTAARTSRDDAVRVTLDLTFFADSYSQAVENFEALQRAIQARGWQYEEPRLNPLEVGEGAFVNRFVVTMNLAGEVQT